MDHLVYEIKENLKLTPLPPLDGSGTGPLSPNGGAGSTGVAGGGGKIKSAGLKGRSSAYSHRVSRATPYHVPPTSRQCDSASGGSINSDGQSAAAAMRRKQRWGRRRYPSTCMNNNKFEVEGPDDPFLMLQELISDGSLIKEAVRRLQLGPPEGFGSAGAAGAAAAAAGGLTPGSNNKASGRHTAYDSDSDNEDCRTPPDVADQVQEQAVAAAAALAAASPVRNRTFPCCEVGL